MQSTTPITTADLIDTLICGADMLRRRFECYGELDEVSAGDLAMLRSRMQGAARVAMDTLEKRAERLLSQP